MKKFLNLWINFKAANPGLIAKYGKLTFDYFVYTHSGMIVSLNHKYGDMSKVMNRYPLYF